VLRTSYSAVEDALNVGQRHVTWPSLCLLSYIDELLENVEHFQMLSEDVAVTTDVVNRRIADVLKHSRLPPAASATLTADVISLLSSPDYSAIIPAGMAADGCFARGL